MKRKTIISSLLLLLPLIANAQVGEYRNVLSVGGNAGFIMSQVGFDPKVPQTMKGGLTFGASFRYVCEKYFNTICSIYGEVNYVSMGWKQDIRTVKGDKVMNSNGLLEEYSRTLNYIQVPIFAHLAWGRETNGMNFFVKAGPQFGYFLTESISRNYDQPTFSNDETGRSNTVTEQEAKPIEKKFDYGIAAGLGVEWSNHRLGHFLIEVRYYYGLGNIYGNTKKDFFGKSNNNSIIVKLTYLIDLTKTK